MKKSKFESGKLVREEDSYDADEESRTLRPFSQVGLVPFMSCGTRTENSNSQNQGNDHDISSSQLNLFIRKSDWNIIQVMLEDSKQFGELQLQRH